MDQLPSPLEHFFSLTFFPISFFFFFSRAGETKIAYLALYQVYHGVTIICYTRKLAQKRNDKPEK